MEHLPSTPQSVFLAELRLKTSASHKTLEQNPYSIALMAHETTINDYRIYLEKLYGFVKPYEQAVFNMLKPYIPDIKSRSKINLLEQDLQAVGVTPDKLKLLPIFKYAVPANVAEAFGAMYVLEGSTLGGNIIYKRLNHLLGINSQVNGKYFTAYGDDSGKYWKGFIESFSNYAVEYAAEKVIINSAINTFNNMDKWLLEEV